jgi:DNA polymerase III sliding clamp (beta) subunit (PCNA family)
VRHSFRRDHVVIEAHAEGRARAAESVAAEFTGDQPVISFNPVYLLDGLTAAAAGAAVTGSGGQGSEATSAAGQARDAGSPETAATEPEAGRIRLEFNSPAKPALITWTSDEERDGVSAFRYLLVPLRVPERT